MTLISGEDHELISRYLARRLTDAEVLVIETRIVAEPGFRNEVELTAAMREGLRELHKRGEVAPLLSPRQTRWGHPRLALAATLTAVALGLASFLFLQRLEQAPLVIAGETLQFERARGGVAGPDVTWHQGGPPVRLTMRFDVGLAPAPQYRVVIERVADGAAASVLETLADTTPDGLVSVEIDSAGLAAGDYAIRLDPIGAAEVSDTIVYALRVAGQR